MFNKNTIIIMLASFGVGFGVSRYVSPSVVDSSSGLGSLFYTSDVSIDEKTIFSLGKDFVIKESDVEESLDKMLEEFKGQDLDIKKEELRSLLVMPMLMKASAMKSFSKSSFVHSSSSFKKRLESLLLASYIERLSSEITEEDIKKEFDDNEEFQKMQEVSFSILRVKSQEEANRILKTLKNGKTLDSINKYKKDVRSMNIILDILRESSDDFSSTLYKALSSLKNGEGSVVNLGENVFAVIYLSKKNIVSGYESVRQFLQRSLSRKIPISVSIEMLKDKNIIFYDKGVASEEVKKTFLKKFKSIIKKKNNYQKK